MIWLATVGMALAGAPSLEALQQDIGSWANPSNGWRVGEHVLPEDVPYFVASIDYAAGMVIADDPTKQGQLDKIHKKYRIKPIDPAANLLTDPEQMRAAFLRSYGRVKTPQKAVQALWDLVISIRPPDPSKYGQPGDVVVENGPQGPVLFMHGNGFPVVQREGKFYIDLPDPFAEPPPPVEDPRPIDDPERIPDYYALLASGATIEVDGTEPTIGPADATYTVVEYLDFFCPHCCAAAAEERTLLENERGVHFVYKVYGLSSECNPAVAQSHMPFRCSVAIAAECAHQQGQFEVARQALFDQQETLINTPEPAILRELMGKVGLDLGKYDACLADPATQQSVLADAQAGARAGVSGTPRYFVRGLFGEQWVQILGHVPQLMAVINAHRHGMALPAPQPAPAD